MLDRERLRELSSLALDVASEAAQLVLEGFSGRGARPRGTREKAAADLVTDYDMESERLIRARLTAESGLPVVGEESGGQASGVTWYCDPIDGTTNFVHGLPFFCVSIGLLDGGDPLAGAVVAPALGLRYRGVAGTAARDGELDAERNGSACRVSQTERPDDALVATGFHPRADAGELADNLASLQNVLPRVRGVRRCGSAALDLCMVADGTYDAYWERTLNIWDCAGGAALVLAAGGRLSDLAGGAPRLAHGHILASNGRIHGAMLGLLDAASKDG